MNISEHIQAGVAAALNKLYELNVEPESIIVQPTRKEFEGDYTAVLFPFVKQLRQSPDELGNTIGEFLKQNDENVDDFSVAKGFLNMKLSNRFWANLLSDISMDDAWFETHPQGGHVLVEFSSPNTNKPLHLGHIRNILLGWSMSRILEAVGNDVKRVQIVNDRGIAICKSMLAWKLFGEGQTPESANVKADHFVGNWYVRFEQEFQKEYAEWQGTDIAASLLADSDKESGDFFKAYKNKYFNEYSELGKQAKDLLLKWEDEDPDTRELWRMMNSWVYQGFDQTYKRLQVSFDKLYYESETYLLGKEMVEEGLESGVFFKRDDGSVWIDLTDAGMDEKILMRKDGTSVYLTQDLGTAHLRYQDFATERMIYVVADEQNYHFKVLFETLKRLDEPYADGLYHLSYGMVDLPEGRMKSREGTVVDADDLLDEVYEEARKAAAERGEIEGLSEEKQDEIIRKISIAALKYFIIKVDPKRRMIFNPAESVDMQGQTGPYIQNAYVRIQSIMRKAGGRPDSARAGYTFNQEERDLLTQLSEYPQLVANAAEQYNPGLIANFCYQLAKTLHRYYHDYRILNAETDTARDQRLLLIEQVGVVLKNGMHLLGIEMPERM